jgi:hypothetical protein
VNGFDVVGWLGGNNGGTVSNASASGAVNGSIRVGGLVGDNDKGTVNESFATGAVTGSTNVGGLVGRLGSGVLDSEAILRDSYYDTQTTGQQVAVGTIEQGDGTAELRGEVAGLSTSQMQGVSAVQNMGTLDFTNTWRVVTNPPGYPELQSTLPTLGRNPPRDVDGDGLFEDVRGDNEFNILDVQALFNNLNNPNLQNNAEAFKFQESSGSDDVTILDVQALFNELQE